MRLTQGDDPCPNSSLLLLWETCPLYFTDSGGENPVFVGPTTCMSLGKKKNLLTFVVVVIVVVNGGQ